jgi:DNA-binding response OmpR family regulator
MKVLVVEDDLNIRAGLDEILRGEGYVTVLA